MRELAEYLLLDHNKKAEYLWANGISIINLKNNQSFNLYSLNTYYVEVVYTATDNQIIDIMPFRRGEHLDKYLYSHLHRSTRLNKLQDCNKIPIVGKVWGNRTNKKTVNTL